MQYDPAGTATWPKFVRVDPYADCNNSGTFTIADFACFQTEFVAACP